MAHIDANDFGREVCSALVRDNRVLSGLTCLENSPMRFGLIGTILVILILALVLKNVALGGIGGLILLILIILLIMGRI